jgi:hypothetical protein
MRIVTDHPIALDSNDHLFPKGAIESDYSGEQFLLELKNEFPDIQSILDLGTGPGYFVVNGVVHGYDICGIEGTDKVDDKEPWLIYKDRYLFHADIRHPFRLGQRQFDLVTAREVLEHMTIETINTVMENIARHTNVFMGTIEFEDTYNELYHTLCMPREWWVNKFKEFGFKDMGYHPILSLMRGEPGVPEKCFWFNK